MKLQQILSTFRRAINDFNMIQDGDKIAIGLSGGKDSLVLLDCFKAYQRFSKEKFDICAINIDMGFKDSNLDKKKEIAAYLEEKEIEYHIVETDIAEIIFDERKESNPCSLCSNMRRGALNTKAKELKCNKLALGHHADDLIETFLLSLFYEGRLSTFMPTLYMDRSQISVIRPLIYTKEKNIRAYAKQLPVLKNPCPMDQHTKREYMKDLLNTVQKDIPFIRERLHSAIISSDRYNLFDKLENYVLNKENNKK